MKGNECLGCSTADTNLKRRRSCVSGCARIDCVHGIDSSAKGLYNRVAVLLVGPLTQAFQSDIADTLEGIKLIVRPRLILTDLAMTNNPALLEILLAPLVEGADPIDFRCEIP